MQESWYKMLSETMKAACNVLKAALNNMKLGSPPKLQEFRVSSFLEKSSKNDVKIRVCFLLFFLCAVHSGPGGRGAQAQLFWFKTT